MGKLRIHYILHLKQVLLLVIIANFFACTSKETRSSSILTVKKSDTAYLDKEYMITIYPKGKKIQIKRAYFDCFNQNRKLNPETYRIEGCSKQLYVINDTVKIVFKPGETGDKVFDNINLVVKNSTDNTVSIMDTSVQYYVANTRVDSTPQPGIRIEDQN